MKIRDRSQKAQEMHAEQLLKVSSGLFLAFFVAILVVPLTAVTSAAFQSGPHSSFLTVFQNLSGSWYGLVFLFCEIGVFLLAGLLKESALNIYDEIYKQ